MAQVIEKPPILLGITVGVRRLIGEWVPALKIASLQKQLATAEATILDMRTRLKEAAADG